MPFAYMRGGKRTSLFKQMRIGKNGNKFYIRKFRSMVVDAEGKLKANEVLYKNILKIIINWSQMKIRELQK